eukprot:TRINITY_DN8174_c0_g1_i1.p1 TRINITY_DN8174_c0_g1~~TRINITY_DN8174_c0_g1_i1.p1  ORF type:complete len:548 (+),score=155.83 TRINITY_DN8174_c0_g1_i1:82-1644(+)
MAAAAGPAFSGLREASLRPATLAAAAGDHQAAAAAAPPRLTRVTVWHNGTWVLRIESVWADETSSAHGADLAVTDDDVQCEQLDIPAGEDVTRVAVRCQHGARNTHVSALMILVAEGRPLGKGWVGGALGEPRWLSMDGHRVVGFIGRAGRFVDALGVIWEPVGAVATPVRSMVFGAPSGVAFEDLPTQDTSQLAPFVLRQAFRKPSPSASPKQKEKEGKQPEALAFRRITSVGRTRSQTTATSQLLETARELFGTLHSIIRENPTKGLPLLFREFEAHFGARVHYQTHQFTPHSPRLAAPSFASTARENSPDSQGPVDWERHAAEEDIQFRWDAFAEHFVLSPCRLYASCQVSAGWRSTWCEAPIPIGPQDESGAVQVALMVEEVRIAALGVRAGLPSAVPGSYVGDSPGAIAYQSTGHLLHATRKQKSLDPAAPFGAGDRVDLLVTPQSTAFYCNGELCGSLPTPAPDDGGLFLAFSAYLGPNTIKVYDQRLWSELQVAQAQQWPPQRVAARRLSRAP